MTEIINSVIADCRAKGIKIDEKATERLEKYCKILIEENEKYNLTAITEPDEIAIKHFADCILFAAELDIKDNARLCDVGSGAGFPGMVIKIIRPDLDVTLIDGLNKRVNFLTELANSLELSVNAVHVRAEEAAKKPELREKFDIVCARAVAAMPVLSELCLPLCRVGGMFAAMKGPSVEEELSRCGGIKLLGGAKPEILYGALPNGDTRRTVIIKKLSQTPTKYPRQFAKISKQPL